MADNVMQSVSCFMRRSWRAPKLPDRFQRDVQHLLRERPKLGQVWPTWIMIGSISAKPCQNLAKSANLASNTEPPQKVFLSAEWSRKFAHTSRALHPALLVKSAREKSVA